jgi:Ger(x)C family germination protein
MKRSVLAGLLALCILLSGCFSYRDINKLLIVVATIIDIDENNNVVIYLEVFKPYRSEQTAGGKGQRLVYKGTGPTILETIRDLNLGTSQKLNFTQNKTLIFTKRAAEKGLDYYIDFLNRDQEFVLRQYMYIYDQNPEDLINTKLKEEEYIGIYLYEIPINQAASAKRNVTRLDDYLNNRLKGNQVNVIPVLQLSKTHMDSQLRMYASAIIKDDKYIGELTFDETAIYNLMTGPLRAGTIIIPFGEDNLVTLEVLASKLKDNIEYDGEKVHLTKEINIRTTFAETQKPIELLQADTQEEIIHIAEAQVKEKVLHLFESWKEKGTDIFMTTNKFKAAYPKEKLDVKDIIKITDIKVNINITMEGSSDVVDYVD